MRALFPSTQLEQHRIFGSGTVGHLCEWGRRKAPIKPAFLSSTHREFQVAEERIQISAEAAFGGLGRVGKSQHSILFRKGKPAHNNAR